MSAEDISRIQEWADFLEEYARDWDKTFENRPDYFTQEFWYILVSCTTAYWKNRPLKIADLTAKMKSGAPNVRRQRISKAVDDGYLTIKEISSP